MGKYVVYKHTSPSGKVYVGMTKQVAEKRWQQGLGYRKQTKFYRAIQKYGWENIRHEVVFSNLSFEAAEQKERELIERYRSFDNRFGYNVERGGNGKKIVSEETREKLRKANTTSESLARLSEMNRLRWSDPAEHERMSKRFRGENNPMFGRKPSAEQIEKLVASNKRRKGEVRDKSSFLGKHHSEESKVKISATRIGAKNWRAKRVLCVETNVVYPCVKDAYRETGIHFSSISRCCRGVGKTAGGYHWKYVDEEV